MQGTYDQTFSLMHSTGSTAFQKAIIRILKFKHYSAKINKLNCIFLYKTNNFKKNESIFVKQVLCPECPEDVEFCESQRDTSRRYHCKTLSNRLGEYVTLYLPSVNDHDHKKEKMKKRIRQVVALNRGASQTLIAKIVGGDKKLVRDCLNELTARGLLRCSERKEHNCLVKRYSIIFD
jgi:hypothetical protein